MLVPPLDCVHQGEGCASDTGGESKCADVVNERCPLDFLLVINFHLDNFLDSLKNVSSVRECYFSPYERVFRRSHGIRRQ